MSASQMLWLSSVSKAEPFRLGRTGYIVSGFALKEIVSVYLPSPVKIKKIRCLMKLGFRLYFILSSKLLLSLIIIHSFTSINFPT